MAKRKEKRDAVEIIADFRDLMISANKELSVYVGEYEKYNKLCSDLNHYIEFGASKDIPKFGRQLSKARKQRRTAKDGQELTQAMAEWYGRNSKDINKLTEIIGKLNSYNNYIQKRTYTPRVLDYMDTD